MTVAPVTVGVRQLPVLGSALVGTAVVASWSASFTDPSRWWAVPLSVAIGASAPWCDARLGAAVADAGRWLTGLGALGVVYLCVPETDQVPLVALLVVVLAVLERGTGTALLWPVAMAAVAWAGLYGATARQSALVGAVVALAVPLVVATVVTRVRRPQVRAWPWSVLVLTVAWAGAVARTGALSRTMEPAVVATVGFGAVLAAAVAVLARVTRAGPAGQVPGPASRPAPGQGPPDRPGPAPDPGHPT